MQKWQMLQETFQIKLLSCEPRST